jgi:hypothetical protein
MYSNYWAVLLTAGAGISANTNYIATERTLKGKGFSNFMIL